MSNLLDVKDDAASGGFPEPEALWWAEALEEALKAQPLTPSGENPGLRASLESLAKTKPEHVRQSPGLVKRVKPRPLTSASVDPFLHTLPGFRTFPGVLTPSGVLSVAPLGDRGRHPSRLQAGLFRFEQAIDWVAEVNPDEELDDQELVGRVLVVLAGVPQLHVLHPLLTNETLECTLTGLGVAGLLLCTVKRARRSHI